MYIIFLAINKPSEADNQNLQNFTYQACNYAPRFCESSEEVFYSIGTNIRNGLRYLYLLSDQYLTQQPLEPLK